MEKKQDNLKKHLYTIKKSPTNVNAQKLKKTHRELSNTYQIEQLEYIQGQTDKIRNFVENSHD